MMGLEFSLGIILGALLNFVVTVREFQRRRRAEEERDQAARLVFELSSGKADALRDATGGKP